ncbi:acyltransferase domain-containing protein [Geodermatophilaceae bacterium NBWT11]|nr:acyltransferase domain-containing protein [Geodermatophilaceae bacterium NBWT11]
MRRAGLLAVLVGLLVALGVAPAWAAPREALTPPAGAPYVGPALDWTSDGAADYADRLGESPSLFAQSVRYPLTDDDELYLRQFVEQATTTGALAVLTLEPTESLGDLTAEDAQRLADELAELTEADDAAFWVRFAPEMNGSWTPWGQQPAAYVDAFRTLADVVHATAPGAAMTWAPAYGAGYPFGTARGEVEGSGPREESALDTDGDGAVTDADDPYAPYWPGPGYVDAVGLSAYHYGLQQDFGANDVPPAGKYEALLSGTEGWSSPTGAGRDFYGTYVTGQDLRMVVQTGAFFAPGDPGADAAQELAVKQGWWRQVFAAAPQFPGIAAVVWLEQERPEAEADDALVDWRATATPELATAFAADLTAAGFTTGAVTTVQDLQSGGTALAQDRARTTTGGGDEMGWIVFCAALALLLFYASGLAGRFLPSWRYPDEHDPRDRRLDLFRGWIIVAVVVTHIEVAGLFSYVTLNAIGAITGAEMFVLLSGVVLGMVYPVAVRRAGAWPAAKAAFRRAGRQYLTALGVVVLVFVLSYVPFIDASVITTFTDRGTGADGSAGAGTVYDLYANAGQLLGYPPPWYAVQQLLLLQMGPWVFNIMGLFVLLSLLVPPLVWLLQRRLWWLVLAVSWGLYVLHAQTDLRVLPSQFEDSFPLLVWQIAFTHGLVVGFYRRQITAALSRVRGKVLVTVLMTAYVGTLVVLWAGSVLHVEPLEGVYDGLYETFYQRTDLQVGRLVDLALVVVVAYAVLTTMWKPVNAAVGWFYTPLGKVSLYVFIVHVFFALAVGNIPGLDRTNPWVGTAVHAVVLALVWLMVRFKVGFRFIPT